LFDEVFSMCVEKFIHYKEIGKIRD